MGSLFKRGIFGENVEGNVLKWADTGKAGSSTQHRMVTETLESISVSSRPGSNEIQDISSAIELSYPNKPHTTL